MICTHACHEGNLLGKINIKSKEVLVRVCFKSNVLIDLFNRWIEDSSKKYY